MSSTLGFTFVWKNNILDFSIVMDINLVVCADSWACCHLIMPSLFVSAQAWIDAAKLRREVPQEIMGTISIERFHYNRNMVSFIQSSEFRSLRKKQMISYFEDHWVYDIQGSFWPPLFDDLLLPTEIIRGAFPPTNFIKHLIPWIEYLLSNTVQSYWDDTEHIGVRLTCNFLMQADSIACLKPMYYAVNAASTSLQALQSGRFSFTSQNQYLAGPASLINHACSRHSNVVVDHKAQEVVINVPRLCQFQRLYSTYNTEAELLKSRGFQCLQCRFANQFSIINRDIEIYYSSQGRVQAKSAHITDALAPCAPDQTTVRAHSQLTPFIPRRRQHTPKWTLSINTQHSKLTSCTALCSDPEVLNKWFNSISTDLSQPGMKRGFGRLPSHLRAAVFYSKDCRCAYKFDSGMSNQGVPFSQTLYEILSTVMPLCNVHEERFWPNAAHVNWYQNG